MAAETAKATSVGHRRPLFRRYVRPGRLCLMRYGPDADKLCIIVDIIDLNRVLVDGPGTGRVEVPIRWLSLTDQYIPKCPRGLKSVTLRRKMKKEGIVKKFNESKWGQKRLAKKKRANLSDFERFKLMVAKKQRSKIVKQKVLSLKKVASAKK